MTVTAEIGGDRIRAVHELCPDIDIHGINSYGGAQSVPERLRAGGASKPYVTHRIRCAGFMGGRQDVVGRPV